MHTGIVCSRAGLLGNPSDGYDGKAIACPVRNFAARVRVVDADAVAVDGGGAVLRFPSAASALGDVFPARADGLERLMLAAARRFALWCGLDASRAAGFTVHGSTTIPRQVGLAGSSAIIIATVRALAQAWSRPIPPFELAELALKVELEDLGIAGGPMDRVVQAYGQLLAMELAEPRSESGYHALDPTLLPPLLVAWSPAPGRPSGIAHGDFRARWTAGDPAVLEIIDELRRLVDQGVEALHAGDHATFADLMDHNFDLRCKVFAVGERDRAMVEIARRHRAAAKLCGSGGAIVAAPRPESSLRDIRQALVAGGYHAQRIEVT